MSETQSGFRSGHLTLAVVQLLASEIYNIDTDSDCAGFNYDLPEKV